MRARAHARVHTPRERACLCACGCMYACICYARDVLMMCSIVVRYHMHGFMSMCASPMRERAHTSCTCTLTGTRTLGHSPTHARIGRTATHSPGVAEQRLTHRCVEAVARGHTGGCVCECGWVGVLVAVEAPSSSFSPTRPPTQPSNHPRFSAINTQTCAHTHSHTHTCSPWAPGRHLLG